METENELNIRKEEAGSRSKTISGLTDQELEQVAGGMAAEDIEYFTNAAKAAFHINAACSHRAMRSLGRAAAREFLLDMAEKIHRTCRVQDKELIRRYAQETLDYIYTNNLYTYLLESIRPEVVQYLNLLV